jgi:hypothetical protein
MAILKRSSKFTIGSLVITVDADDVARLGSHQWKLTEADQNQLMPYADVGRPGEPVYLPLSNFLLNVDNTVFVERRDRSGADFRKGNLRVSR